MSKIIDRLSAVVAPESWRSEVAQQAPRIMAVALSLAILGQAALIVTRFEHLRADRRRLSSPAGSARPDAGGRRTLDVAAIARAHLFGMAPGGSLAGRRGAAPATRMALALTGTLASEDPKAGLAILGPMAASADVYTVGQNIPGGARLNAVYQTHVLIERDGTIESLSLPHELGRAMTSAAAVIAPPPPDVADASTDGPPPIIGGAISPRYSARRGPRGYLLYPGNDMAAFKALGLEPGDLATEIDGKPLDNQMQGGAIVHALNNEESARVTILRNGEQREVNLNLAQVAAQLAAESQSEP